MNSLIKNEVGNVYGFLKVILYDGRKYQPSGQSKTMWKCICQCGNITSVDAYALRSGNTKSCSKCNKAQSESAIKDITNNKYGFLTVILLYKTLNRKTYWKCKCECGNIIIATKSNLLNGNTKSCGCLKSYGLKLIQQILNRFNVKYKKQVLFLNLIGKNGGRLKFDFAILCDDNSIKCLILYQGKQHYITSLTYFGKYQRLYSDLIKRKYCKENNIKLYLIKYDLNILNSLLRILLLQDNTVPSLIEGVTTIQ